MARNVSVDSSEVRELQRIFGTTAPKKLKRAMRFALGRTRTGSRKEASTKVREEYNIKAGRLKKGIVLTRPNFSNFSFRIIGKVRPIGLLNFSGKSGPVRQTRAGISVATNVGDRKLIKSAFIARGLNGNIQVFSRFTDEGALLPKRKMTKGRFVGEKRRVIRSVKGPSAADMIDGAEVEEHITEFAQDKFLEELQRNLKFLLGRT